MKVLIQRVKHAKVTIDGTVNGQIKDGFLLFVGMTHEDDAKTVEKLANKVKDLRLFEDEQGKMNKSLLDVNGSILSISQFTLLITSFISSFDNSRASTTLLIPSSSKK